jgi:hypothetical protein
MSQILVFQVILKKVSDNIYCADYIKEEGHFKIQFSKKFGYGIKIE